MTRFLTCGLVAACVLGLALRQAQGQAPQAPIFRGGSDVVRVFVTVTDHDGKLVANLTRDAFELRDEGKPQPITQFDNSPQPIRLIVMLDVSGSMEGNLPLLRGAAAQLFARLGKDDVARVGAFGNDVVLSPAPTYTYDRCPPAVRLAATCCSVDPVAAMSSVEPQTNTSDVRSSVSSSVAKSGGNAPPCSFAYN